MYPENDKRGRAQWNYNGYIVLDIYQKPDDHMHALSNCIIKLVTNCNVSHHNTKETLKLIFLQHGFKNHEARD